MWKLVENLLRRLDFQRQRRSIARALALDDWQEVRRDGLKLIDASHRLELRWTARGIHPWDLQLPTQDRATTSFDQYLADTESALLRLFQGLPYIDVIDFSVVDPASDLVIISGTVHRSTLSTVRSLLSVRMRLKLMGVCFSLPGLSQDAEPD